MSSYMSGLCETWEKVSGFMPSSGVSTIPSVVGEYNASPQRPALTRFVNMSLHLLVVLCVFLQSKIF